MGLDTWVYRYRSPVLDKQRRVSLGNTSSISLKDARTRAARHRANIDDGLDPVLEQEKQVAAENARLERDRLTAEAEAKRMTLQEVGEYYYRECDAGRQTQNSKGPKRPTILRVERPYFDKTIVPALGQIKI